MSETDQNVANHTLALLRLLDKRFQLVLETLTRHSTQLGRLDRNLSETEERLMREIREIKSEMILSDNRVITAQTEILTILHRLSEQDK